MAPGAAHPYAQTNLQLFEQVRGSGWSDADVERLAAGYDLAVDLFSAAFRASGKPFLAHLAGVASILVALGEGPALVTAGLLHAAYSHGDFGDGERGTTAARRDRVRAVAGEEAEELIAAYPDLEWKDGAVEDLVARAPELAGGERDLVLVRLVNDLEDLLDRGLAYSGKPFERGEAVVALARALGQARLARELERWVAAHAEAVPAALRRDATSSFAVPPALALPRSPAGTGRP